VKSASAADVAKRQELGRRARQVVEANRGAIDRTLDRLEPFVSGTSS